MAIFADVVDEWKKASGKEKLLIVGGGAAVIVLALYLHSKSSSQSLAGTGTTGVGGSFQQASPGSASSPGSPGSTGTTGTTGTTGSSNFQGTVRAAGLFPGWDASHTGVPIRSGPGGSIIGYAPWSSTLSIFGSQQGPSNQAGDPSAASLGSTTWYQVYFNGIQAWVSAADVGLSPATQPTLPPGSFQPLTSSVAPRGVQPNHTMTVYANTRHSAPIVPTRTLQAPPGPPARAH